MSSALESFLAMKSLVSGVASRAESKAALEEEKSAFLSGRRDFLLLLETSEIEW